MHPFWSREERAAKRFSVYTSSISTITPISAHSDDRMTLRDATRSQTITTIRERSPPSHPATHSSLQSNVADCHKQLHDGDINTILYALDTLSELCRKHRQDFIAVFISFNIPQDLTTLLGTITSVQIQQKILNLLIDFCFYFISFFYRSLFLTTTRWKGTSTSRLTTIY